MLLVVATFFCLCSRTEPVKLPSSTCGQGVPFLVPFLMPNVIVNWGFLTDTRMYVIQNINLSGRSNHLDFCVT